jgi:hypothetical protein
MKTLRLALAAMLFLLVNAPYAEPNDESNDRPEVMQAHAALVK